jgi:chemotaxis signal transduction protein
MRQHDDLLPYMRQVLTAERDLHEQTLSWSMIEASAAIGCPEQVDSILPTLSGTRDRFSRLQQRLVQALAGENVGALEEELQAAGQCAVDILVRNLYERTADVGFLATDAPLRSFCGASPQARAETAAALQQRLQEYRAKYSVYDDIALLAADGQVLLRLAGELPAQPCREGWFTAALAARKYVEHYGPSVLSASADPTLLYAHRVEQADGSTAGVLVLRFRIADEAQRIFDSLTGGRANLSLTLLDTQDRVVLSSDIAHVPLGSTMRPLQVPGVGLTAFAGREYMAVDCQARPYQGYAGPGWRARAMVSLLVAFRSRHPATDDGGQPVALGSGELQQIQAEVDAINRNLRRVVWNGQLTAGRTDQAPGAAQASLKAVLQQVTLASERMRERVDLAIEDLYRASVGRVCTRAQELARLAADLLDRNLYERANDCRWWALSPALAGGLARGDTAAMARVLQDIHALYTVYRRLVVFDAHGAVRATSLAGDDGVLLGQVVPTAWLEAMRGLQSTQQYAVAAFEATPFSDGEHALTYLARVTDPTSGAVLGGVAVVFDAARELRAILDDVLGGRDGVAAFIDEAGRVMACTDATWQPGPGGLPAWPVPPGRPLVEHDDRHHAQGMVPSSGYREYLVHDGQRSRTRAVVMLRMGRVERRRSGPLVGAVQVRRSTAGKLGATEIALFQVGPARYAVSASAALEALPMDRLLRTPQSGSSLYLGLLPGPGHEAGMLPVLCARRLMGLDYPGREGDGVGIVLADPQRPDQPRMVLRVDDVTAVLAVTSTQVQDMPDGLRQGAAWLRAVVRLQSAEEGQPSLLVQWVDPVALIRMACAAGAVAAGALAPMTALAASAQVSAQA